MADGVQFAGLIILAGGQSRRMGRDKALLPLAGEIMVRRVIRRLSLRGKWAIMVSSNQPEKFPGLEVPVVPDQLLEGGPLAGIHACLETSPCELNLVTACDLPFVSGGGGPTTSGPGGHWNLGCGRSCSREPSSSLVRSVQSSMPKAVGSVFQGGWPPGYRFSERGRKPVMYPVNFLIKSSST